MFYLNFHRCKFSFNKFSMIDLNKILCAKKTHSMRIQNIYLTKYFDTKFRQNWYQPNKINSKYNKNTIRLFISLVCNAARGFVSPIIIVIYVCEINFLLPKGSSPMLFWLFAFTFCWVKFHGDNTFPLAEEERNQSQIEQLKIAAPVVKQKYARSMLSNGIFSLCYEYMNMMWRPTWTCNKIEWIRKMEKIPKWVNSSCS